MAVELGLGFLVGSLIILAVVLYFTRIRNPVVPHAGTVDRARGEVATQTCELCGEERVCTEVKGMTVCAACEEDLLA